MQDPLKQGLKLSILVDDGKDIPIIRMQDPLKQGLKPNLPLLHHIYDSLNSNARSIKTRIETIC